MNTTNNPIVRKLAETLEAKTTAAVANLHNLRVEIMQAIEQAEDNARSIIHAEQITLDIDVEQALAAFTDRLHEMARDAVGRATGMVLCHVEALAGSPPIVTTTSEPEPMADPNAAFIARSREFAEVAYAARQQAEQEQEANPEPTPEPTPALTVPDASGKQVPWRSQFEAQPEAQPTEQEPETADVPSPVAAHAVESAPVGVLPEDDQDQDDQDQDGIEDAGVMFAASGEAYVETVMNPDGLHSRSGEGRKTRYTLVELPLPGEVYYRKQGRKWLPVRYMV